ncbi:MAG: acyl-CoA dehydratase activase-related protein, partial [bacterium]
GERCTVFMENSLMANLKKGVAINDLLSGLAYSIVENYINRVVSGKRIGENIFFQGGVAFNKSVVAAFEKFLDTKITVPPHHDVTGAIGMALIARDHADRNRTATSTFKGFGIHQKTYETSSFECRGCPNVCEINRVKIEGEEDLLFYGGRCEKYDIRRKKEQTVPDLFAYREEILWKEHLRRQAEFRSQESGARNQKSEAEAGSQEDKTKTERLAAAGRRPAKIGIPYIFLLHDYLPFWTTFFWELGFEVVVSPKTNRQIVNLGVETVQSESCFPVKVAHGHIRHLLQSEVDMIFLPSFIRVSSPGMSFSGSPCPYTQSIPYMAAAAFGTDRFIKPVIDMSQGEGPVVREMFMALEPKRVKMRDIKNAYRAAQASQDECERLKKEKGAEVLESLHSTAVVIVGRGYNSFDRGANLQIPQKLATLDMLSIPMDFLPLDAVDISGRWENMYWRNGTRILQAARIIKSHPHLFPIFIGNFSCGPDSFILKYFTEELGSKPFLHIEIDEHSADAGAITRCEAYLDSIRNFRPGQEAVSPVPAVKRVSIASLRKRKIYIPKMSDHAYALSAAFTSMGIEAAVMPPTDETAIKLGRKHVSGKECYPCAVTTGDMLKQIAATGFDPGRSAFFMPSGTGPCRFGQYHVFQRLILDRCGYPDVKIYSPVQSTQFYHDLGIAGRDFATTSWKGIIAIELLTKMLHETRPYERDEGESCAVYHHYLHRIENTLKRGGNGSLEQVLKDMHDDFRRVARDSEPKPLVGIVGEIFVRSNAFSNESIVKKVEQLGGEAWLAPVEEWIYYVNTMALRKALRKKEGSAIIELFLKSFFQKRIEHRYAKHFDGYLKTLREPKTRDILRKAAPYIHDSFEGEAVLSIGKTIDLIERGASGIINVMPFGCMPGTVVSALLQTISRKYHVPCISIGYDGTESTTTYLQLEAFMEQAKSRHTQSLLNSRQSEDRPSDRRGTYLKGG